MMGGTGPADATLDSLVRNPAIENGPAARACWVWVARGITGTFVNVTGGMFGRRGQRNADRATQTTQDTPSTCSTRSRKAISSGSPALPPSTSTA